MLRVRTSPNSKQRTSTKGNEVNPEWNEDFEFYLNPAKKNTLGKLISFTCISVLKSINTVPT